MQKYVCNLSLNKIIVLVILFVICHLQIKITELSYLYIDPFNLCDYNQLLSNTMGMNKWTKDTVLRIYNLAGEEGDTNKINIKC